MTRQSLAWPIGVRRSDYTLLPDGTFARTEIAEWGWCRVMQTVIRGRNGKLLRVERNQVKVSRHDEPPPVLDSAKAGA